MALCMLVQNLQLGGKMEDEGGSLRPIISFGHGITYRLLTLHRGKRVVDYHTTEALE